jgi:hypothetical protein
MNEKATDLERLRRLRAEYDRVMGALPFTSPAHQEDYRRISDEFSEAAFAALGPEGCVTKELERFQEQYAGMRDLAAREQVGCKQFMAERDALKSESALLHQRCDKLEAQNKAMLLHTTDAQKENAALLARNVKRSAAAKYVVRWHYQHAEEGAHFDLQELRAVLNEIPPEPSWGPSWDPA